MNIFKKRTKEKKITAREIRYKGYSILLEVVEILHKNEISIDFKVRWTVCGHQEEVDARPDYLIRHCERMVEHAAEYIQKLSMKESRIKKTIDWVQNVVRNPPSEI